MVDGSSFHPAHAFNSIRHTYDAITTIGAAKKPFDVCLIRVGTVEVA